ncbi:hypothetical protein SLA2020_288120 [Shorea laevis]
MSNRNKRQSGCFSSLLRRILCAGSPQTHPSDNMVELDEATEFVDEGKIQLQVAASASAGPGVVARLMGLESLPEKNRVPIGKSPGPVTRSRSVNFMDYLLEFDLTESKHRRVRTSVSFREVPPVLQQNQNQEFVVVYWEDEMDKSKEAVAKQRKSERRHGSGSKQREVNVKERLAKKEENQRKKNKKISKLKNEPRRVAGKNSSGSSRNGVRIKRGVNSKAKAPLKMVDQTKKNKNQIGVSKAEYEYNSDTSSPLSVFDANDFAFYHENSFPEVPRSMEMELSPNKTCISITEDLKLTKKKCSEPKDMNETEFYLELAGVLCKLTGEDIRQSKWTSGKGGLEFEDFEELCMEFGEHILNFMLYQVLDELVEFQTCR